METANCFLDKNRVCNKKCTAFFNAANQNNCLILQNIGKLEFLINLRQE